MHENIVWASLHCQVANLRNTFIRCFWTDRPKEVQSGLTTDPKLGTDNNILTSL